MPPKRRGRAAKQRQADEPSAPVESASDGSASPKPQKRRGRSVQQQPPNVAESGNAAGPDETPPSQPTKAKGRPAKKQPLEIVGDNASPVEPPSPPSTKTKRRPAKQQPMEVDSDDAGPNGTPSPLPKKAKGRPTKQQSPTASTQGRGRSPPNEDESMASAIKESGSEADEQHLNGTMDAEKTLVAAMKPLSLKRKADTDLDLSSLKRARRGRVLVFGTGECAQLGLTEDRTERKFPTPVDLNDRIVSIACGGLHNIAVTDDGDVWTWGCNDEKALGRSGDEWVPGKVDMPVPVIKVTAGDSHSMALGVDGRVYSWGAYRDTNGMMGFNPNTGEPCATPIPVFLQGKRVIDIASGVNHSLALLETGHIYEWGHIRIGQRVARHHRMNLLQPRLVNVRSIGKVEKIFAGAYQSFAVTAAGKVYAFGMNQYGQSGIDGKNKEQLHKPEEIVGLRDKKVIKLVGGLHHSLALLADGHVLSFGRNNYGELGMGDLNERRVPTLVPGLDNIVDIACGSTHSLAVSRSGDAYSCGFGEMLQLGNGQAEDRNKFEKVGGQQLDGNDVVACGAGAQHSVLIVASRGSSAADAPSQ